MKTFAIFAVLLIWAATLPADPAGAGQTQEAYTIVAGADYQKNEEAVDESTEQDESISGEDIEEEDDGDYEDEDDGSEDSDEEEYEEDEEPESGR